MVRMRTVGCKFISQGMVGLTLNHLQAFLPLHVRMLARTVLLQQVVLAVLRQMVVVIIRGSCLMRQLVEIRV